MAAKDEACKGELPAPLMSPDCDLRHFKGMTFEVARLQRSKSWRLCEARPELGFYMLNLWMASWHELPAASLEDDEDQLCALAKCKPDHWAEVRGEVMRGWVKCSDGRLYHPVVSELAREAIRKSRNSRNAAEVRWKKPSKTKPQDANAMRPQCQEGIEGREGKGKNPSDSKNIIFTLREGGWALDEAAIEDGLAVGLTRAEVEAAGAQHAAWWEANQPAARKTRDGWTLAWRARCDDLASDPEKRAKLARASKAKPARMIDPPPIPDAGPEWWRNAARILRTESPARWTSYWSRCAAGDEPGLVFTDHASTAALIRNNGVASEATRLLGFELRADVKTGAP